MAQELAEVHVHRRQVIQRADAQAQHVVGGLHRLAGQPRDQLRGQRPRILLAAGEQAHQVRSALLVDGHEGIEYRRYQDRAALVRLGERGQAHGVGQLVAVLVVDRLAQRRVASGSLAELARQPGQPGAFRESAAARFQLAGDDFRQGEMHHQRDDVGERLVEGQAVDAGGFDVAPVQAVEDRVGGFVGDDVVGQRGEHPAARQVHPRIAQRGLEVAEQQRLLARAVIGIGLAQRMRIDAQLGHRPVLVAIPDRRPEDLPPQRPLEQLDGLHRHGEDHLLMEARIALGRREAVLRQQVRVVEVHRLVELVAGGIDVDDFQVFVHRSRRDTLLPALLPGNRNRGVVDPCGLDQRRRLRVEGVHAQLAHRRLQIVGMAHRMPPCRSQWPGMGEWLRSKARYPPARQGADRRFPRCSR